MVLSAVLAIFFLDVAGLSIPQFLLLTALFNAAVALYIFTLVPEFLMRFVVWILVNIVYRLRAQGLERIPDKGPAVVVCNHISYMDALVVIGGCRRPIRFVMDHQIFKIPLLSFVFRTAGAVPIAPARKPGNSGASLRPGRPLSGSGRGGGDLPEGRLTEDGEIGPFKSGIERIVHARRRRWCRWRCAGCGAAFSAVVTVRRCTIFPDGSGRESNCWWVNRCRPNRRLRRCYASESVGLAGRLAMRRVYGA